MKIDYIRESKPPVKEVVLTLLPEEAYLIYRLLAKTNDVGELGKLSGCLYEKMWNAESNLKIAEGSVYFNVNITMEEFKAAAYKWLGGV